MGIRVLQTLALLCLTVMSIACNACGLAGGNQLMAQIGQAERRWQGQWTSVAFDPTYSFPSQISFDNPEVYDEDMAWIVLTFEVLE